MRSIRTLLLAGPAAAATPQPVRDALAAGSTLHGVASGGSGSPDRLLFGTY